MNLLGPRGLLSNYPDDVVYVIDGEAITKEDILNAKRKRQRRQLVAKRCNREPFIRSCFIWTFYNDGFIYGGWWLYVQSIKTGWEISPHRQKELVLKIMKLFPCGYLPMVENFEFWKAAFAEAYYHPTRKRPARQGMAIARAQISPSGMLLDIYKIQISCRQAEAVEV